ncbi:MAG: hypothetical protein ABIH72_00005, partial [archaeon]
LIIMNRTLIYILIGLMFGAAIGFFISFPFVAWQNSSCPIGLECDLPTFHYTLPFTIIGAILGALIGFIISKVKKTRQKGK